MSLESAIRRLKRARVIMTDLSLFFEHHALAWRLLAKQTALEVLLLNKPQETDPDEWANQSLYVAEQISLQLTGKTLFERAGVTIYLGSRRERNFSSTMMAAMTENIALEDIADYVKAGLDGDPLGKPDIDSRDDGKTPQQIAMTISRSIEQGNEDREAQIRRFISERMNSDAQKLYKAILQAWVVVFTVRVRDDWREYVRNELNSRVVS